MPWPSPNFADFERRALAGAHLNVVFFGASLTWGANASDPPLTSYRAHVARQFEAAYPGTRPIHAALFGSGQKRVHREKPFTVTREEAQQIISLASEKGLRVGSAPDTFLGGAHQTCRQL